MGKKMSHFPQGFVHVQNTQKYNSKHHLHVSDSLCYSHWSRASTFVQFDHSYFWELSGGIPHMLAKESFPIGHCHGSTVTPSSNSITLSQVLLQTFAGVPRFSAWHRVICLLPLQLKNYFYLCIWLCWVLLAAWRIFSCSMWDLDPWPGMNPEPLNWEHRVLATGPPGKSLPYNFNRHHCLWVSFHTNKQDYIKYFC